jgi:hypothetical protein
MLPNEKDFRNRTNPGLVTTGNNTANRLLNPNRQIAGAGTVNSKVATESRH